jgi:hypothetical protein
MYGKNSDPEGIRLEMSAVKLFFGLVTSVAKGGTHKLLQLFLNPRHDHPLKSSSTS